MTLEARVLHGDCTTLLRDVVDSSVDAVITDPPYPEIDRVYGRMTEAEWHALMEVVISECRRVLKPHGSAMFIIQPNSSQVGSVRAWAFEFIAKWAREWNLVQDVWWWNISAPTVCGANQKDGLLRPAIKACVWLGPPDCYRRQDCVLWSKGEDFEERALRYEKKAALLGYEPVEKHPSGIRTIRARMFRTAQRRGGTVPPNLLPIANSSRGDQEGGRYHGARTPQKLSDWWTAYIGPSAGVILDPFCGTATMGVSAIKFGLSFIGIEKEQRFCEISRKRLASAQRRTGFGLGRLIK